MKKEKIISFLIAYIDLWDNTDDELKEGLSNVYSEFLETYSLPELSAEELLSDLRNNKIILE